MELGLGRKIGIRKTRINNNNGLMSVVLHEGRLERNGDDGGNSSKRNDEKR